MNYAKTCIYDNADTSLLHLDLEAIEICCCFFINLFILGIVARLNMLTLMLYGIIFK